MYAPDYDALDDALPDRVQPGGEPEVVGMHELGDRFLAVSEAMPRVGRQGVFGFVYGELTHLLGDVMDGKPEVAHLPRIENPDVLIRQANYFAQEWFNPSHDLVAWGKAWQAGDMEKARSIAWGSDQLWRRSFDEPAVQLASPPIQLIAGGLTNHIVKDLPPSLIKSGVTESYMRPGGDYDNVSQHISFVSRRLATEMMSGNRAVLRTGALSVARAVAVMRGMAKHTYDELRGADDQESYDEIVRRSTRSAIRMNSFTLNKGEPVVKLFGRMALIGAEPKPAPRG